MSAADVLRDAYNLADDEAALLADALLAHGEQGVAILKVDGSLWNVQLMPVSPSAEGVRRAWLVPLSAEAGDTDGD